VLVYTSNASNEATYLKTILTTMCERCRYTILVHTSKEAPVITLLLPCYCNKMPIYRWWYAHLPITFTTLCLLHCEVRELADDIFMATRAYACMPQLQWRRLNYKASAITSTLTHSSAKYTDRKWIRISNQRVIKRRTPVRNRCQQLPWGSVRQKAESR